MWRAYEDQRGKTGVAEGREAYMTYIIMQAIIITSHVILREGWKGVVISELDFIKINSGLP